MAPRIDAEVRAVLAGAVVDGTSVRLSDQLSTDLYDRVRKVLGELGGYWHSGQGAHVFPEDPRMAIARYVAGDTKWHDRAADNFVATPDELAEKLAGVYFADVAELPDGADVLEPSAGDGALVRAIHAAHSRVQVVAVEPNAGRAERLGPDEARRLVTFRTTLEDFARPHRPKFDAVAMNPPFRGPGNAALWIDHVRLAFDLLSPGGLLVSVVPATYGYRSDRRHKELRELVERHTGTFTPLPADAFGGIGFGAGIITVGRPLDDDGPTPWILRRPDGEPVRVPELRLSGRAAAQMPVQLYRHGWTGQERVCRYLGRCAVCPRRLWGHDDGEDDPRGVLGFHCANYVSVHPWGGRTGPSVGLCVPCGESGEAARAKARALAEALWTPAPPEGEPAPEPEPAGAAIPGTLAELLASVPGVPVRTSPAGTYAQPRTGASATSAPVRTSPASGVRTRARRTGANAKR